MLISIANYMEADRRTALAGEALVQGAVIKLAGDGTNRVATKATAQADIQKVGAYALAFKVDTEPTDVSAGLGASVPSASGGTIASGDFIVECRRGSVLEYDPSLLDDSLNPANGGTLPAGGDALAMTATGIPCATSAGGAITTPVILRCYNVVQGKVRIELL